MTQQDIERTLKQYTNGACVITAKEFAKYYNCGTDRAYRLLRSANVSKVVGKYFIPELAKKLYQGQVK